MNVVINKIPKELGIEDESISFKAFAKKFINYMEDLEDIEKVKNEMNNKADESFDYSLIRGEYV